MPFKLKEASCVAVGTFNIYVFQLPFFVQTRLVDEGVLVKFEQDLSQPGFRITFPNPYQINWVVRPDRIVATTNDPDADCGVALSTILHTLPGTPIRAIGINFEFQTSHEEFGQMPVSQTLESIARGDVSQKAIHVGLEESPHVLNIQISKTSTGVDLNCNFHTEINEATSGKRSRVEQSQFAADISKRFAEFRTRATNRVHEVFGVDLSYANNHNI